METQYTKQEKINIIKEISKDYDVTTNYELELDCSPVFERNERFNILMTIESYEQDSVEVVAYFKDDELDSIYVPYNELSDELIDEIFNNFLNYQQNASN